MIKAKIIGFLVLFIAIHGYGQKTRLKQKVEKRLNASGQRSMQLIEDYNEQGFKLKWSMLSSTGEIKSSRSYNFDSLGIVVSDTGFNNKNEIVDIWKYTYDQQGEIINQHRYYPKRNDTYIEMYKNTYDSNNNLIEQTQYDKDSTLDWVYKYKYDKDKQRTNFTSTFQGTIRNEKTYKYKKGLLVKEFLYDFENDELEKKKNTLYYFKYNKSGKLLKKTVHSVAEHLKEKEITEYHYSYNKDGNLIAIKRFLNKQFDSIKIYDCTYW